MKKRFALAVLLLGLLIASGADSREHNRQNNPNLTMRQYRLNLERIPKALPPQQKYILKQQFKRQMVYEKWKKRASAVRAAAAHKATADKP